MKEFKKIFLLLIFLVLLINFADFAEGFGLSMSYNDKDRPLELNFGESKEIEFTLLSSAREFNKKIRLDIIEGMEIASLEKKDFDLPSDGEIKGFIKIQAPQLEIDDEKSFKKEYLVSISFKEVSSEETKGTVSFSSSSKTSFLVKILDPSELLFETNTKFYLIFSFILLFVLIIFILIFLLRAKKKNISFKKSKNHKFR